MPQFSALLTLQGQAKVATSISGGASVNISHLAVGDGNGAPVTPLETQTALVREVWRDTVLSVSRDPARPTEVIVTAEIPVGAGPFTIREMALITSDGQLFAVQNTPELDKTTAAQGATQSVTVMFRVVVATTANITITIDPADLVSVGGLMRAPFISIDSFSNGPPANPAAGALVVVGAVPTGAFVGLAHRFAQWDGFVWRLAEAKLGTVVFDNGTLRYFKRTAGGWAPFDATMTDKGLISLGDLFINASVTKSIGPAGDFADLAAAFQWLRHRIICDGVVVTLALAAGVHVMAAGLVIDYPFADKVTITGAALTGGGFPTDANFNITGNSAGARAADRAAALTMLRARIPTEVRFPGVNGIKTQVPIGSIENILFTSDTAGTCVDLDHDGALRNVATVGSAQGIQAGYTQTGRSFIHLENCVVVGAASAYGFSLSSRITVGHLIGAYSCQNSGFGGRMAQVFGIYAAARLVARGNGTHGHHYRFCTFQYELTFVSRNNAGNGFLLAEACNLFALSIVANNNGTQGLDVRSGSRVFAPAVGAGVANEVKDNGGYGILAADLAHVDLSASAGGTLTISGNWASGAVYAVRRSYLNLSNGILTASSAALMSSLQGSHVIVTGATLTGTLSPAVNTVGNGNAYIQS